LLSQTNPAPKPRLEPSHRHLHVRACLSRAEAEACDGEGHTLALYEQPSKPENKTLLRLLKMTWHILLQWWLETVQEL